MAPCHAWSMAAARVKPSLLLLARLLAAQALAQQVTGARVPCPISPELLDVAPPVPPCHPEPGIPGHHAHAWR